MEAVSSRSRTEKATGSCERLSEVVTVTPTGPLADPAPQRRGTLLAHVQAAYAPALLALTVTGIAAVFAVIGADARWLAALGGVIWHRGAIPSGVPFAAAPTAHWANAIVLAELIFHGLEAGLGDRGLMVAQLIAVAFASFWLARDALAGGAARQGTIAALLLAAVGALGDLAVARVQLFSIALFPLAVALLRGESRNPSRRIWFIVPLLALWSNLHGTALIGLGIALAYLALGRLREDPRTAVGVAICASAALCATPAGIHTIAYYHGVLTNEAAQRGQGLWAPLSLGAPLDVVLIIAAIALAARLRHAGADAWELVVLVVLAVLTVKASRMGIWLLFFVAPLSARTFKPRHAWDRLLPVFSTLALAGLVLGVARGPLSNGAGRPLIARAVALSDGAPVLAEDLFAEQIALAGGRIWVGNPIDAFTKHDQLTYLNWLAGDAAGLKALGSAIRVVITARNDPAQRLMAHDRAFRLVALDQYAALYLRRS